MAQPNIVIVMVDDMDARMVEDLPRLQSLLAGGLSFSSCYVAAPQCCPSRAAFLRGQYPHNTGVLDNGPPQGGYTAFRNQGNEGSTIATWLKGAGYRTGLIGKYLNDYERFAKHVPVGWDRWFVYAGKGKYTNFLISDQGKVRTYGKRNGKKKFKKRQYQTDLLARNAVQFINTTPADKPLFLYLAPSAPHAPAIPADRHRRAATTRGGAPRVPSFDAGDMSHKRVKAADSLYVKQLRAMFAVEDMIADVIDALREQNRLDNTYLFFASDNGLHHGEHGIVNNKNTPFEESIRTPLIVLGPGVPAGQTTEAMASLIDLGPTFAALAGVAAPDFVDGRSLKPVLQSGNTPVGWRTTVLSELLRGPKKGFTALRTGPHAYVAYGDGDRELYDLEHDPYELDQLYETAPSSLKDDLEAQYQALHDCGAEGGEPTTCQDADGGG